LDIGWFSDMNPHQSTSKAKIIDGLMPAKSRTALFILFGNYLYIRKNTEKPV
jgi:hypothetical protein